MFGFNSRGAKIDYVHVYITDYDMSGYNRVEFILPLELILFEVRMCSFLFSNWFSHINNF